MDLFERKAEFERKEATTPPLHYYGDTVRNLFLSGAGILILSTALDRGLFTFYLFVGIIILLALVILAGLTSPKQRTSILADAILSGVLFVFFEFSALVGNTDLRTDIFTYAFLLRQLLAVIFLLALYFSIKTLRGME